jgi:hypothetical protein
MHDRSLPKEVPLMIMKTKISPSDAARPRDLAGASLPGGVTCAAGSHRIDGTGLSIVVTDALGVRPTYVPTMQAFLLGDRAWSPPV